MKSAVTIITGRHKGSRGWINGDLNNLNPHVSRVWFVFGVSHHLAGCQVMMDIDALILTADIAPPAEPEFPFVEGEV